MTTAPPILCHECRRPVGRDLVCHECRPILHSQRRCRFCGEDDYRQRVYGLLTDGWVGDDVCPVCAFVELA